MAADRIVNLGFFAGGMPGPFELLLILFVVLLLFGAKRLPDLARSLGRSLGEFRKGREEGEQEKKPSSSSGPRAETEEDDDAA
jgi:sec-independent protein translocase protein TatA